MQVAPEITSREFKLSEFNEDLIRQSIDELDTVFDNIISCKVKLEMDSRRRRTQNVYSAVIELVVPNATLMADRQQNEDLTIAIRDAFDAIRRVLDDYVSKIRRDVKSHVEQPRGRVLRLFPDQDYGFIESSRGDQIYFH